MFSEQTLRDLLAILTGFSAIVAAIAWVARSAISHAMSRDLERMKGDLQRQAAVELERFKADMLRTGKEHEIRFTALHERRSNLLLEAIALIDECHTSVSTWKSFQSLNIYVDNKDAEAEDTAAAKRVHSAIVKFWTFHNKNRLYFSRALDRTISSLQEDLQAPLEEWQNAGCRSEIVWEIGRLSHFLERIDATRDSIEQEFRVLIGVEG